MSWTLGGVAIRSPHQKKVTDDINEATNRTLSGKFYRDFIGSKKKIFDCAWRPIEKADFDTIMAAYDSQADSGTNVALVISESGLTFSANVLIVVANYDFSIPNTYTYRDFQVKFIEQ